MILMMVAPFVPPPTVKGVGAHVVHMWCTQRTMRQQEGPSDGVPG